MWPRMLLDLLPHFARLLPIADKYLAGKSASDKAHETLAAEVRDRLGQVTEAQAGLSRQLQHQDAQIAEIGVEVTRARMGIENVEERVAKLEKTANLAVRLLLVTLLLAAMTFVLVVVRKAH